MWQSLFKQLSTLRGIINELTPLVKSAYPSLNYAAALSTSSAESVVKVSTHANPSAAFRLVTGYYGISKDIFSGKNMPIFDKEKCTFGDDSWFVASHKHADVIGVADGVGGWREMGVDPSKFSSSLMQQCKRVVEQDLIYPGSSARPSSEQINERTPVDILVESYQCLRDAKDPSLIGSSTACILVFNRETRLVHAANLGDSGFVIVRNNKIVHRSQEQSHYFNAPFQLSIVPSAQPGRGGQSSEQMSSFSDRPESASVSSFELTEGDFVVLGTDGLWDNLSDGLLLLKISKIQSFSLEDLQNAAREIVDVAVELAQDPDYLSPFAISARKNGIHFRGGKPDDITVILARVTKG